MNPGFLGAYQPGSHEVLVALGAVGKGALKVIFPRLVKDFLEFLQIEVVRPPVADPRGKFFGVFPVRVSAGGDEFHHPFVAEDAPAI